jgi:protein-glutamine gamma-glutamyltransferase
MIGRSRSRRQTAGNAPPASVAARIAALAVAATAIACLAGSGGLSSTLVPLAAAAMALAELLNLRRTPRVDSVLRSVVLPIALVLCAGPAVYALSAAAGDPDLVRSAGARLAAGALVVMPLAGATRRDLLTRLALAAATAGLAASAAGNEILLPGLLFAVSGLMMLALLERDRVSAAGGATSVARSQGPTPPLAAGVAAVVVTALLTISFTNRIGLPERPASLGARGLSTPAAAAHRLDAGSASMDLRQRGSLSDTPVARVATSDELLWRSTVLTSYTGRGWRARSSSSDGSDGTNSDGTNSDGSGVPVARSPLRTDTVTLLSRSNPLLMSPGEVQALQPSVGRSLGYGGAWRMPLGEYTVTSSAAAVGENDRTPITAPASDPDTLELPVLPERVVRLAHELTETARTRSQAVDAVVQHLKQDYRYRLDSPVPALGEDAVDDFLFQSREGFCEQFASAAAVLLRTVGVPTRLAVGYAAGEPTSAGRLLRGTDAHAWIEVEFPDAGWMAVDPTAGAQRAAADDAGWRAWRAYGAGTALLTLLGLGSGVALGLGGAVMQRRRREQELEPLDRALLGLDRSLGQRRRRPDETLREFADRLRLTPGETAAVVVAERGSYGRLRPGPGERRAAAATLDHAARRLRDSRRAGVTAPSGPSGGAIEPD